MRPLNLVTSVSEVHRTVAVGRSNGKRIGFVPTMGFLHEGHLALMRTARQECDMVVVSIFVNPKQFGPREDFGRYPRDLDRDLALCRTVPADLVFAPAVSEIYPQPFLTAVHVTGVTEGLCGRSRPGHFDGVATVVAKLFNIVRPDAAYFGQKDAQQVAVIRRMAADLNFDDVEIKTIATVRDLDGLALSSRNAYLSAEEREAATILYRSLMKARNQALAGERDMIGLRDRLHSWISATPLADIDYVEIVDPATLQPVESLDHQALALVAVRFGATRLIDNIMLET